MSLEQSNLFEKTLIEPLNQGANKLYIVSGYATARMAFRHFEYAKIIHKNLSINLIIGMCPIDGVEKNNHKSLKGLHSGEFNVDFTCDYIVNSPAVHSKVYVWCKNDEPIVGFVGSANYTQNAFSTSMREVLVAESGFKCLKYYNDLLGETMSCVDPRIEEFVDIYENNQLRRNISHEPIDLGDHTSSIIKGLPKVTLTLLDSRTGNTPEKSGLNWGQRPGREPNQAYINIPVAIGRSGFFPSRFETFTVITDDEKQMICVRAQDGGKGLHTTLNNSLLGEYFRYRLGLANGEYITKEHLLKYGRTDVDFYKIDEENYFLDFSVH